MFLRFAVIARRRQRSLFARVLCDLAVLLALGGLVVDGAILWTVHRSHQRALGATRTLMVREYRRAVHSPPVLPGTFADIVEAELPAFRRRWDEYSKEYATAKAGERDVPWDAINEGRVPPSFLPAALRDAASDTRPIVDRILQATHAQMGGASRRFGYIGGPFARCPGGTERCEMHWSDLFFVSYMARLQIAEALFERRFEESAERCADGLALARDAAWGTGTEGLEVAELIQD